MKIAQVAPLFESVPPRGYGGTERIVSYLTEELVRLGHEVTLFASGDSRTSSELVSVLPEALRLAGRSTNFLAPHLCMFERVAAEASRFDFIHFHTDILHFSLARRLNRPHLTTLHGRMDLEELGPVYEEFNDIPVCSISDSQRDPLPWAHWRGTVYHGLPDGVYRFHEGPGDYLAFLGRIAPEKRPDRAIRIARLCGMKLKIAAKIDPADQEYYSREIEPLIAAAGDGVEFVGEIGEADKDEFLGNARALLFPIDWPEPFGLVMIESLATGTPVIAYGHGSVREVIDDGLTGFVVDSVGGAVAAVQRLTEVDRAECRRAFELRFTARRMAEGYLQLYRELMGEQTKPARAEGRAGRRRLERHGVRPPAGSMMPPGLLGIAPALNPERPADVDPSVPEV